LDEVLAEAETPLGYTAVLRRQSWERHEAKRVELRGQVGNIALVLAVPEAIVATQDGCHHYYKRGYGTGKLEGSYLHVLVRHFETDEPQHRTVVSAWFTKVLEKGDILWSRTS
jgi:hypothetical protein